MTSKVVLVTGANQGLGYAIVQVSALRQPSYTYILCSRDVKKGKEAVQQLKDAGVTATVDLLQLDVTDDEQIAAAVKYVDSTYGRLDGMASSVLLGSASESSSPYLCCSPSQQRWGPPTYTRDRSPAIHPPHDI